MSATVEETLCHLFHGKVVNRTQTDPYAIVYAVILAKGYAALHAFYLQWNIYKPLTVSTHVVKIFHVLACHSIVARVEVIKDIEFL